MKQTAKKQPEKQPTKQRAGRPPTDERAMDVNLSLRMPRELRDAAMARSKRTGVSVAFVVRKRLEEWVASGE